jgi:taurine dioxygenase
MNRPTSALNGEFGILIEQVKRHDLVDPNFQSQAYSLWLQYGGLLAVRGKDLEDVSPEELVAWSKAFGTVEEEIPASREDKMVSGFPILRLGNMKNEETGKPIAQFTVVPPLVSDEDIRYNPTTKRPVWHTDSTFRQNPPIGSVLHCRQAPACGGAATLFGDMTGAFAQLDADKKRHLSSFEAICSLAHHDQKIHSYSPECPILSPEQRAANPPNRVPLVLKHPVTGKLALYGLNSSTCAIVPIGQEINQKDLDLWDLQGIEDVSVQHIWRDMLPDVTSPEWTVKFQWQPGDIVVWDNRCTIHAPTGFDHQRCTREMWRLTVLDNNNKTAG